VPDPRPVTQVDAARVRAAVARLRAAQEALEEAIAQALKNGASIRSVAELGLSPNTVQKYGRAHGWPTEENRDRFYESRDDREERERRGHSQRGWDGLAGSGRHTGET
jgi:type II secretory pathway pseudopilin PulG